MRIGIDIMGGDYAPHEILKGTVLACKELDESTRIYLFGKKSDILNGLDELKFSTDNFEIVDCSETIEMGDDPVKAFMSKTDSSITKGFAYLKNGLIDGFASAGNTGAMLVGATQVIGVIDGIIRPTIASVYPNIQGKMNLILDVGINADTKPEVLYQFGVIGSHYVKTMFDIDNPKVGLLNIGEEESKGSSLAKAAHQLMKNSKDFNFIGNVEGGSLNNSDVVDVVVTDGFTGNVVLKQAESFFNLIKFRKINDSYFDNFNYENYGGTPILGINKTVVVGHGISNNYAIKNMLINTSEMCKLKLSENIQKII